jgi:hypothetical protein
MDLLSLRDDCVACDRLLGERVAPAIAVARLPILFEELLPDGGLEGCEHDTLVGFSHLDEQSVVEGAAEHGARSKHLDVLGFEPPETEEHCLAHRLRHPEGVERASLPARVGAEDLAPVERLPQQLLEHERVALRARVEKPGELSAYRLGVQDGRDQLRDVGRRHRRDRDRLREPRSPPDLNRARQGVAPVELVASVGGEKHHPAPDEPPCHVVEQLTRRAVGPVDVIEDEEQAAVTGPQLEERHD